MEDKKFTDEKIIKALEYCGNYKVQACDNCPFEPSGDCYKGSLSCCDELIRKALSLINRQKAEIERLQKYNTDVAFKHYNDGKAEAIKEFAERLKYTLTINNEENTEIFDYDYTLETIDQIAKELQEEQG